MQPHKLVRCGTALHPTYQCSLCGECWSTRPDRFAPCFGVPVYHAWSKVPEDLKTRTMLEAEGLRPGALPAACYGERRGKKRLLYWLYSMSQARPKRRIPHCNRGGRATEGVTKGRVGTFEWLWADGITKTMTQVPEKRSCSFSTSQIRTPKPSLPGLDEWFPCGW